VKQKSFFQSIKSKKEITKLFQKSKSFNTHFFYVKHLSNKNQTDVLPLVILWAISKKTGSAVYRNKIKRRCKAALFQTMKELSFNNFHQSYNIVFIPRKEVASISFEVLKDEMKLILDKVNSQNK